MKERKMSRPLRILTLYFSLLVFIFTYQSSSEENDKKFGLVIHGGAGTLTPEKMTEEQEEKYRNSLEKALKSGYEILEKGGSSLDAVEQVINILEDDSLFNAGKGAVFTAEGTNELDASIMDGKTLNAGAVAGVKHIKNPISLAKLVMTNSPHVMLSGEGAEEFAKENKVKTVGKDYFFTQRRWESLQNKIKKKEDTSDDDKKGTVGCVALDKNGNLAAGTSTGGMTYKKFGRIGDSPVIGAGTYANNKTCAVSSTGHGEYFIRNVVAYDISALIEYKGISLKEAADHIIHKKLKEIGGIGGVIAINTKGEIAMPFNTAGMYRGYYLSGSAPVVKIFKD